MKRIRNRMVCAGLYLLAACGSSGQSSLQNSTIGAGGLALNLGDGYDTLTGEVRGECVVGDSATPTLGASGAKVEFTLVKVEDQKRLNTLLNVSASATLKSSLNDVTGSAAFSRTVNINDYSVYVMVKVSVNNALYKITNYALKPDKYELLERDGKEAFRKICGDEFIVASQTGGELFGVLQITTKSKEDKEEVSAKIAGSYGNFSGEGEFKRNMTEITKNKSLQVYIYQNGGNRDGMTLSADGLLEAALKFPAAVSNEFRPQIVKAFDYNTLALPAGKNPIDVEQQKLVIQKLANLKLALIAISNNIDYALTHTEQFKDLDQNALQQTSNDIATAFNKVHEKATLCFSDYTKCRFPTDLQVPSFTMPQRVESTVCQNPQFNLRQDELCGIANYNVKRGSVCGVELYKAIRGVACGVKTYKKKTTKSCGVKQYKSRAGAECGKEHRHSVTELTIRLPFGKKIKHCRVNGGIENRDCHQACTARGFIGVDGSRCYKHKTCRHKSFGAASYKTCRHSKHGVQEFKTCRKKKFGVEKYKSCAHPSFGPQSYKTCRLESFGLEQCLDQ